MLYSPVSLFDILQCLLGNKYGYRPLKASIPSQTFQKLIDIVSSCETIDQEDIDLVQKWYVEDTNAVPAVYVLQPITAHLPSYYDSKDAQEQSVARDTWWKMFERMRKVFDEAARLATEAGVYAEDEMHTFVMSGQWIIYFNPLKMYNCGITPILDPVRDMSGAVINRLF